MSQTSPVDGCPRLHQLMDVPDFQLMDVPDFPDFTRLHQSSKRPELPDIFRYSVYIGGLEVNVVGAVDAFDAKVGVI
jgi:hypothetical protein